MSDSTSGIITAAGRLTEAGMDADEAVEAVLRIAREVKAEARGG
ncbi:MAG: hypothetical protein Q7W02_08355 [Candidatus Rokubacteria bacterium]|nr:hypothetical protein [Candidatus Rokubacteria bacterium]